MKAWTAHEHDTTLSCCRSLHVKHAAYVSALYTLNISILVVLLYSWRIGVNAKRYKELDDVYYGLSCRTTYYTTSAILWADGNIATSLKYRVTPQATFNGMKMNRCLILRILLTISDWFLTAFKNGGGYMFLCVQIAYFAIIGTQMFMILLSIFLFYGIYKENVAFLVPWVVGCMTFMALEAMAMVYSNILRDHVNKQFDAICKAEISFLIPRIILNCVCIWCVLRLYHLLRAGVTWKGAAAIEL